MSEKTVYYITNNFPPEGRAAALLRGYQCLYLLEAGWRVEVITATTPQTTEQTFLDRLMVFPNFALHRFSAPSSYFWYEVSERLGFVHDAEVVWTQNVKRSLNLEARPNSVILATTGGSLGPLEIGVFLKEQLGRPLVLNFRDPVVNTTVEGRRMDGWAPSRDDREKACLQKTDFLVASTERLKTTLKEKYNFSADKAAVIYGGYAQSVPSFNKQPAEFELNIGFAGGITRNQKPEIIVRALGLLEESIARKIRLHFWGTRGIEERTLIPSRLKAKVKTHAFKPREEFLNEFLQEIDVGFLSLHGDYFRYALPSKIFEYINAQKPVLASGPEGELKRFIEDNRIGLWSHFEDPAKLAEHMTKLLQNPAMLNDLTRHVQAIKPKLSTQVQTKALSDILQKFL